MDITNSLIRKAMKVRLPDTLPDYPAFKDGIRRAPDRGFRLTEAQARIALQNALRYVPEEHHAVIAPEFMEELLARGRIYAYRYRPEGRIYGRPVETYKGTCLHTKALQVMMENNLDFDVALYPYELVTYGESGRVLQNWLQYLLVKQYLEVMEPDQTLVIQSGHPLGLFQSSPEAPRVINSNGILVGMYDNLEDWEIGAEMGVTSYGQMTAGGWFFIGPQGIIHGCYNMILNAARKYGMGEHSDDLRGLLYVTAGLGSISSAQAKAAQISQCVSIIAEVDPTAVDHLLQKGWIDDASEDLEAVIAKTKTSLKDQKGLVIAYRGNIVDLLEFLVEHEIHVHILSDQTSCHIPYEGGYTPQGITYEEGRELLKKNRSKYRELVDASLHRHYRCVRALTERGSFFLEYGNSLMESMYNAGIHELSRNGLDKKDGFIYPDFIEAITGPELFDYGYGPFRWVCLSGTEEDLRKTDEAALNCIDPERRPQDRDNYNWIKNAGKNDLVIGTKARMLYQDVEGRIRIALKFNDMVRRKETGPIMIGRDHHDTGGADCPIRETSNIRDGSNITADMAVHCFAGNACRGMTFLALHNGGGVGIGRSIHTGFSLLLDGSDRVDEIIRKGINWDVMGGVARRSWARNAHSLEVAMEHNAKTRDSITLPYLAEPSLVEYVVEKGFRHSGLSSPRQEIPLNISKEKGGKKDSVCKWKNKSNKNKEGKA